MTSADITLSPSEELTDRVVRELDATPAGEWSGVLDRLVRAHPMQKDVIYGTAELHRQFAQRAAPVAPARRLGPGDRLGPFEIVRLLRRGGMGEVYLARQSALDRAVALKVVRRGFVSPVARAKFAQENQVLARLHHSNIVPVHFTGEDGGLQYCVMHLVDGVPLDEVIAEVGRRVSAGAGVSSDVSTLRGVVGAVPSTLDPATRLSPTVGDPGAGAAAVVPSPPATLTAGYCGEAADLIAQAADALQHAHSCGVIHRDVKPSNLLVDRNAKLWVIDFGLAGVVRREGETIAPLAPRSADAVDWQTTLGGTPQYMPPEQFAGKTSERSDVYSLGLVLYELLTTRPAFPRADWPTVERQVKAAGPLDPQAVVPSVPTDLAAIVRKATANDPARRYQSAADFAADLRRWQKGMPTAARPLGPLTRLWMWVRRNPWPTVAVAAVLLAVVAVVVGVTGVQVAGAQAAAAGQKAEREKAEFARGVLEVQQASGVRPARSGWVKDIRGKLSALLATRPGADLRDVAADTLSGLDASPVRHWDVDEDKNRSAGYAAVAFSPDGKKVVAGGWKHPKMPPSAAAVWDGNNANPPVNTTRAGAGGVAFPDADSPLTLLPPIDGEKGPVLWNVATNQKVLELPLPGAGTVIRTTLSADARFAAAVFTPSAKDGKPQTVLWAIDRAAGTSKKLDDWPGESTALAFSPKGELLAAGTAGGDVTVRTTADGNVVREVREGEHRVTGLGFGRSFLRPSGWRAEKPDAASEWLLGVGNHGGELSVWDLRTTTRLNRHHGSEHAVYAVGFSPDGTTVYSAGRSVAFAWDVASARQMLGFSTAKEATHLRNRTEGLAVSADGRKVAFGSPFHFSPGGLDVFRLELHRGVQTFRGLSGAVQRVWLSADGKYVAALAGWRLGVWDRPSGKALFVWSTPAGVTEDDSAAAFHGDSIYFASGKNATRWSLTTGERVDGWQLERGWDDHVVVRPGRPPLLARTEVFDEPRGKRLVRVRELTPKGELKPVYEVGESFHDLELVSVSADGRMCVSEIPKEGDRRSHFFTAADGKPSPVTSDALPPDRPVVLSANGRVAWATETLADRVTRTTVVRAADGKRLATHDTTDLFAVDDAGKLGLVLAHGGVQLVRLADGRPVVWFDTGRPVVKETVHLSGDGTVIAWGRPDGTVCVADVNACLEKLAEFGKR